MMKCGTGSFLCMNSANSFSASEHEIGFVEKFEKTKSPFTLPAPWGPRTLLFVASILFFWASATARE